jgi:gliding motility-associated-like protein
MNQIYKISCFSFILFCFSMTSHATHFMGGEITWECQSNGQYIFRLVIYRDCNGVTISSSSETIDVDGNSNLFSIKANFVSKADISPPCADPLQKLSCGSGGAYEGNGDGAVEQYIYESALTTISGVPPATGWAFTWSSCCRNGTIDNLQNPDTYGITLRAIMYPYNGQNTDPCYDSSPQFAASASTVLCMGYPFTYNNLATDVDLDSIAYSWAEPLDDFSGTYSPPANPSPIPFITGYTYNSPLPGTSQNINNVPATMNPLTGEISYTSYTSGNFVTVIKVESWRCGQLIAEVYREIQIVMYDCSGNLPPSVNGPFIDPITNLYTVYADTVLAGDMVTFQLAATDFGTLWNGNPQTLTLGAYGIQFGTNYTSSTSGCPYPPCATLSPPPPYSQPYGLTTTFSWQTDCDQVNISGGSFGNSCYQQTNTYTFVVNVYDDNCPAPSINNITFTITIMGWDVISAPEIRCASVAANGDVNLTWDLPVDTDSTFNSYHIFASDTFNGTYSVVDSVFSFYQNTYTLTAAKQTSLFGTTSQSDTLYFYIMSRSGCGGAVYSLSSDTIKSIYLNVANVNEVAVLSWNQLYDPTNLPTSSNLYYIYREYPIGTWALLDSTTALTYTDSISVCNDSVAYRIEIYDSIGCYSVSSLDGNRFKDNIVPEIPFLDTVSVDANDLATIGWEQSTSMDVVGYIIYKLISGVWQPIDTAFGISTTSYLNMNSTAGSAYEQYRIASIDSCDNTSPMGDIHNTIFITPSLDVCSSEITLTWNAYDGWGTGAVGQYYLYASENGVDTVLITQVSGTTTSAVHSGLTQYSTYCYFVQAIDTSGLFTSTSNDTCIYANVPQQPLFVYHNLVTVVSPGSIYATCFIDLSADVLLYKVMRSLDAVSFDLMDYANVDTNTSFISYLDNSVLTEEQSYYYKFISVDTCGNDGLESNVSRSILLKAFASESEQNYLYWNDYEGWLGSVNEYNIYRSIDDGTEQLITSLPYVGSLTNKYIDDVSLYIDSEGDFCYRIEAVEGNGNPYSMMDTSYSNYACVEQLPLVHTANAFTPDGDGLNDTYIPVQAYMNLEGYEFSVFNSWGGQIFSTSDPQEGWNGTSNGVPSQDGVYLYIVKYKVMGESYMDKKGTITLLK